MGRLLSTLLVREIREGSQAEASSAVVGRNAEFGLCLLI